MTARPIHYDELLDLADELAGVGAGPGRPKTIKLRRSVSTSYYALFHYLGVSAAEMLCGSDPAAAAQRNRAARWIAHTDVLSLSEAVLKPGRPLAGVLLRPADDLSRIAEAFVSLQTAREKADYDHEFDISRAEAIDLAYTAHDAITRADQMWESEEPSYMLFLRLMVGAVRIAKNR